VSSILSRAARGVVGALEDVEEEEDEGAEDEEEDEEDDEDEEGEGPEEDEDPEEFPRDASLDGFFFPRFRRRGVDGENWMRDGDETKSSIFLFTIFSLSLKRTRNKMERDGEDCLC